MTRRQRKLIGAFFMVAFVLLYAMAVTTLAGPLLAGAGKLGEAVFYLVAGLAWAVPLLPLIRWMERRGPGEA